MTLWAMRSRPLVSSIVAAALSVLALGGASASAASFSSIMAGPDLGYAALAGDSVVWSQGPVNRANVVYRASPDGRILEVFRTGAPVAPEVVFSPVVDASASVLAIGYGVDAVSEDGFSSPRWSAVRAGAVGGTVPVIADRNLAVDRYDLAVSGDRVATIERRAPGSSTCVVRVRDVVAASAVTVGAPLACSSATEAGVRLAGSFVAVWSESAITVIRWATDEVQYRVKTAAGAPGWDLQDDGTVEVEVAANAVVWASIAEPFPHRVATPRRSGQVRLASGRFAYIRRRFSALTSPQDPSRELVVQPLDGEARPVSFPFALALAPFDFDGSRVALLTHRCLYVGDVSSGPAPDAPPGGACPGVVIAFTGVADFPDPGLSWNRATRTLTAKVFCESAGTSGCAGPLMVTGTARRTGRRITIKAGAFQAPRFGVSRARLQLSRAALSGLRRVGRSSVRLSVVAAASDPAGAVVTAHASLQVRLP